VDSAAPHEQRAAGLENSNPAIAIKSPSTEKLFNPFAARGAARLLAKDLKRPK